MKDAEELVVYDTISDLYQALGFPVTQDLDFSIHSLSEIHKEVPFKSPLFRAEYFSFVFIKNAQGQYTSGTRKFGFRPYTIYFTNPGHVKAFEIDEMNEAYIITMTESFLRKNVHPDIFNEFPYLLAETFEPWYLEETEYLEFESIYHQIYQEYKKESLYKSKILGNLFVVMLLKIKEKFCTNYCAITEGGRNSEIVKHFKKALESQFSGLTGSNDVYGTHLQDYAEMLKLHPNYLNNVIKSKTGKTVNDWINQRMISTAMYLLKSSTLTSKEIGNKLGFSQPTHFSRFFKKQTGITPSNYKKAPL